MAALAIPPDTREDELIVHARLLLLEGTRGSISVSTCTVLNTEVEITCGHRSISVHFTSMTDHYYARSVGATDRKFRPRLPRSGSLGTKLSSGDETKVARGHMVVVRVLQAV